MNGIDDYLRRAKDIIGDRTPAEKTYDDEVLRGLERGEPILQAIARASEKYPDEALDVDATSAADAAAHYKYLQEHEKILSKMGKPMPKQHHDEGPRSGSISPDDTALAVLSRIEQRNTDRAALIVSCEQLDGIPATKVESLLKQLKKEGLIFGEQREGKTHYKLTVQGKARARGLPSPRDDNQADKSKGATGTAAGTEDSTKQVKVVEALIHQGEKAIQDKDYQVAYVHYVDALKKAEEFKDSYGIAQAYAGMGHTFFHQNQLSFAEDCYQRALDAGKRANDYENVAANLNNLFNIRCLRRDMAGIKEQYKRAFDTFSDAKDFERLGKLLSNYSNVLAENGRYADAEAALKTAADHVAGEAPIPLHGIIQDNLGQVYHWLNRPGDAIACYQKAIVVFLALKAWEQAGDSLLNLGIELTNRGDVDAAKLALQQALVQYAKCKQPRNAARARQLLDVK